MKIGALSKEIIDLLVFECFTPKICEAGKSPECPRPKIIPYLSF